MKKYLAILLAILMLLAALPMSAFAEEEVVTLTYLSNGNRPQNEYTDETWQYIKDNLGIDLQVTQAPENFTQQLALLVASGDIPDLIWMDYNTYVSYAEEGLFYDIGDLVANYPAIMEYVDTNGMGEYCWNRMTIDGSIYGVPTRSVNPTMYTAAIRQDWLDAKGLAVPTTLDELTEVLRIFTEEDPDGNGQNDTYGASFTGMDYASVFFGAFGATSMMDYFLNEDGTITTNVISDEYKEALIYLNDIFEKGYIDPESFTQANSQTYEKFATSSHGYWPCWWSNGGSVYMKYGFAENNPDGQVTMMDAITGPDGDVGLPACDPVYMTLGISYTCENVEKALELINWECTPHGWYTAQNGVEGDYFEIDETGKLTWYWGLEGKNKRGDEIADMEIYKFIENLGLQAQMYTLDESDYGAKRTAGIATCMRANAYQNLFMGMYTDEFNNLNSELDNYYTNMSVKFIMGELDIEAEWDNYVSTYLSMGGEAVRTSLLEKYNAENGTAYTFA
ncbi:MAG: extracellular solute-binding protein [Firmicutes bacterium]|nr:extracellular solute-binding protein [Bacillota bacterium]